MTNSPTQAKNTNAPPPGWGDDELTKFLDAGKSNQWATFHRKRPAVATLIATATGTTVGACTP